MNPVNSSEFRINDADRELHLKKGSHVSFGLDHWIDPQALLVDLIYVRSIDIAKVDGESLTILAHLRQQHPDLHAQLLKIVRQKQRK